MDYLELKKGGKQITKAQFYKIFNDVLIESHVSTKQLKEIDAHLISSVLFDRLKEYIDNE
jgi:hypothetical protein